MRYFNTSIAKLVELALQRKEGILTNTGAFLVYTGIHTGRSPNDKFIVDSAEIQSDIWWENNQKISESQFEILHNRMLNYLRGKDLFIFSGYAGADPHYSLSVKVINECAWQNIFVQQLLFTSQSINQPIAAEPQLTILAVPGFTAVPNIDGTNSENFILIHLHKKIILIGGTHYAGEIKKSIFSLMNYLLPNQGILPMHCAANQTPDGNTTLFFGLSGTGKTSLSSDAAYRLIGDDEHAWSPEGIFNIEAGCYAKCIGLCSRKEPQIWNALKFGTVLENVVIDNADRIPNYASQTLTENTRAAYPMSHIYHSVFPGTGSHPKTIILLTADAFGVLPPIAKLTPEQALYYFLLGYTSKLAGTERGITEPQATFSACFGAPFLPLPPVIYANLLKEKIASHQSQMFLVNTGWQGGCYGVGKRIDIQYTRKMVAAAIAGSLAAVPYVTDPIFNLHIPTSCPEIPSDLLIPSECWKDKAAYLETAHYLASLFRAKALEAGIPEELRLTGPGAIN